MQQENYSLQLKVLPEASGKDVAQASCSGASEKDVWVPSPFASSVCSKRGSVPGKALSKVSGKDSGVVDEGLVWAPSPYASSVCSKRGSVSCKVLSKASSKEVAQVSGSGASKTPVSKALSTGGSTKRKAPEEDAAEVSWPCEFCGWIARGTARQVTCAKHKHMRQQHKARSRKLQCRLARALGSVASVVKFYLLFLMLSGLVRLPGILSSSTRDALLLRPTGLCLGLSGAMQMAAAPPRDSRSIALLVAASRKI